MKCEKESRAHIAHSIHLQVLAKKGYVAVLQPHARALKLSHHIVTACSCSCSEPVQSSQLSGKYRSALRAWYCAASWHPA